MTGTQGRTRAQVADLVAMSDSEHTSALPTHRIIAAHLCKTLHALGFDTGRVLVHGDDPGAFLRQPDAVGYGFASLTATLGPDYRRGEQIRVENFTDTGEDFDLVIAALPFNDVKLTHPAHQQRRRILEDVFTLASLDFTRPGGLTVVLASHTLLDFPRPQIRQEIARHADLIAAVRLPGGIARNIAGTDAPTDLLLLARAAPDQPPTGIEFTSVTPVVVDGRTLLLNSYFDARPDHVLGQLGVDHLAVGPNALTVTADPRHFYTDLGAALDDIAADALEAGTAGSRHAPVTDVRSPAPDHPATGGAGRDPSHSRAREPADPDPDPEHLGEPGFGLW